MKMTPFPYQVILLLGLAGWLEESAAWETPKISFSGERGRCSCMAPGGDLLEQGFREVCWSARPWVYWWWLNGNVDEQTIHRDLEAMAKVGIGGFLLFDARGYHDDPDHVVLPTPRMEFMSPQWRQMVRLALDKTAQLGLEASMNLSLCAGSLKGPWPVGEDAPKKLLWQSIEIQGPRKFTDPLSYPEGRRFWSVALLGVKTAETPSPGVEAPTKPIFSDWQELHARTQLATGKPAPPAKQAIEVVDLTDRLSQAGRVEWEVPAGRWTLLWFGYTTMEGRDYDVDILDAKAVEGHFQRMAKPLLEDAGPLAGKTLTHFYTVSWEGALPTWTRQFDIQFQQRRGYSIRPWLPVLAGWVVQEPEQSRRFLRDYHKTLAECFQDNYYGKLQALCHRHGLRWHAESGGPWDRSLAVFAQADQLAFLGRTDMPQGEFWWGGEDPTRHRGFNRSAAMTAHIYSKPLAAAEAFTHMVHHWSAYPAVLKPPADSAFCEGINHLIWHTFTASPAEFGLPGIEYFAGTHLNPNVTWFPWAGPFLSYLGRCQWMLRQGHFVADVAVYVGDRPYMGWSSLRAKWDQKTTWSPLASWKLPKGYSYDLINTEVILHRLAVEAGRLRLPEGMGYRLLVVDLEDETIEPAAIRKLVELAKAGATVVLGGRRPKQAPGLTQYPDCDRLVTQWTEELWRLGISGKSLEEVLRAKGLAPDWEGPDQWNYIHRHTPTADIYFLASEQTAPNPSPAECTFRVAGKQPELWDPVTGQIAPALGWQPTEDGRTKVTFGLPEHGSLFVVFRKPGQPAQTIADSPSPKETRILSGPWQVEFPPGRGAQASVCFDQLTAWNEHPEKAIRYFSGTAVYRKTFDLSAEEAARSVRIHLGRVYCIGEVRLNGKDLGTVWTAPWSVEATGAVRPGKNELAIAVTNTWVNRLIGDAALPAEKRITRTNVALRPGKREPNFRPYQGFTSEDALQPSGLLGPVRLEFFGLPAAR